MTRWKRDERISEFHRTFIQEVRELSSCAIPIFATKVGRKSLVGTATLFHFIDYVFICTAGHVLKSYDDCDLVMRLDMGEASLNPADFIHIEEFDIAFCQVRPSSYVQIRNICHAKDLCWQRPSDKSYSAIVGFPVTRSMGDTAYIISGVSLYSDHAYYDIRHTKSRYYSIESNKKVSAPNPHGMSGGPLFCLDTNSDGAKVKLAGIATKFSRQQHMCQDGSLSYDRIRCVTLSAILRCSGMGFCK